MHTIDIKESLTLFIFLIQLGQHNTEAAPQATLEVSTLQTWLSISFYKHKYWLSKPNLIGKR